MAKKKEKYRLQPLLDVRIRNKRNAEIALGKAFKILKDEQEQLVKLEHAKKAIIKQREDARKEMAEVLRRNRGSKDPDREGGGAGGQRETGLYRRLQRG